jgi:hypothetical protein
MQLAGRSRGRGGGWADGRARGQRAIRCCGERTLHPMRAPVGRDTGGSGGDSKSAIDHARERYMGVAKPGANLPLPAKGQAPPGPGTPPQDEVGCAGTHFVNPKFGRWRPIAPTLTNPPMPNPICQSWVAFGAPRAHRRTVEHAGGAAPRRRSGHALALLASLPSCFSCCAPGRRGRGRGLLQSHSIRSSLSMSLGTRARRRGRQLRPRSQAPRHA